MLSYERAVDHPWLCAAFAAVCTLFFSSGLTSLTVTTNPEKALDENDPEVRYYENFRENFSEEISLSILLTAEDVFQVPVLESVIRLSGTIPEIDGVSEIESLTTVQAYTLRESGGVDFRPLLLTVPKSNNELRFFRETVERNPFISGTLVSGAGDAIAIHVMFETRASGRPTDKELVDTVEVLLDNERGRLGDTCEIFQIGSAPTRVAESRHVLRDAVTLTPIAILIVLVILFFCFRSWIAIILPISTGILSIAATLGFMGMMNYPLTPLTSTIPTLLMVLGCTEDIHLLSEYAGGIRKGLSKSQAIRHMASECWRPILLTFLTTLTGFLVLSINGITYLREYATTASFGILVNFLITVSLTPVLLRVFPSTHSFRGSGLLDRVQESFLSFYFRHRFIAIAGVVLVTGVVVTGASRIVVTSDPMTFFFSKDSEIRKNYFEAKERFHGFDLLYVVVETNRDHGVQDPEMLGRIADFSEKLGGHFSGIQSYPEIIRIVHQQFLAYRKNQQPSLELNAENIRFYNTVLPKRTRERFLDFNASRTVLFVPAGTTDSKKISRISDEILDMAGGFFGSDIEVTITGPLANVSRVANGLARNLTQDLALSSAAILLAVGIFFRSARISLLAVIPNFIPLLVTFGLMGWMGTPLSLGTYPTALIVISIAVDDTIHFIARFMKQRSRVSSSADAASEALRLEFKPVLCSSLAISLGFLVLAFADCITIRHSGYLASIALASALVVDLVITPALLARFSGKHTTLSQEV